MTTATNVAALTRNTQPVPIAAIISPATAGPAMRAVLNVMELSATALVSAPGPTISPAKDCRTGASTAAKQPFTKHST